MEALYNNGDTVYAITAYLEADDALGLLASSKPLYAHRNAERFWRQLCSTSFGVVATVGPNQAVLATYAATFAAWKSSFSRYPVWKVRRVFAFWNEYVAWAQDQFPEVLPTLNGAASDEQLDELEAALHKQLPETLRLLYRFHAGQTMFDRAADQPSRISASSAVRAMFGGMFGGYLFYNHLQTCQLLGLDSVLRWNHYDNDTSILFAGSHDLRKRLYLSATAVEANIEGAGTFPCHPRAADPLLAWLEEFMRRIRQGAYAVGPLSTLEYITPVPPPNRISLHSRRALSICSDNQMLGGSIAVTQGIQVKASGVLVPEMSGILQYLWTYSIRIRVVRDQCPYVSTQLTRRFWVIEQENKPPEEVNGEAVIGMYPKFGPNEIENDFEFVYASACSGSGRTVMSGYFTFVPGTKDNPTGDPFKVDIAPFELQIPHYIY